MQVIARFTGGICGPVFLSYFTLLAILVPARFNDAVYAVSRALSLTVPIIGSCISIMALFQMVRLIYRKTRWAVAIILWIASLAWIAILEGIYHCVAIDVFSLNRILSAGVAIGAICVALSPDRARPYTSWVIRTHLLVISLALLVQAYTHVRLQAVLVHSAQLPLAEWHQVMNSTAQKRLYWELLTAQVVIVGACLSMVLVTWTSESRKSGGGATISAAQV